MATLLLSAGGQFIGGALGGPIGATIGRALGAAVGSSFDQRIFGPQTDRPTAHINLLTSREGEPVPRLYGWSKITGNIVWATHLQRQTESGAGAKATRQGEEDVITANFAIALCQGPVSHLGRIWADGRLMDLRGNIYRFYTGSKEQLPDSLIEAKQGAGNAPAYRGTAYLVFEQLDLSPYGNRIPQISVELCKPVGDLEERTRAICVIPGATEFGYDPVPRVRVLGTSAVVSENTHQVTGQSDWEVSIDELQALCPNLEHVSVVVSWFGDDLRCANCTLSPRVVSHDREIEGVEWSVAGLSRREARVCSTVDGKPAYGGTPNDAALIAAIHDLGARGLKVTIYPMIMMDIPATNDLPNPYDADLKQPSYPWRGRITCDPAIDRTLTVDQTMAARTQINLFAGTCVAADFSVNNNLPCYQGPDEWSYRRFILHCANVARAAGGVDAFIIGSEMVSLSTVRDGNSEFPFVDHLRAIAADVSEILGTACKITYAADWSEYHGYQPASARGDKFFHLDPLWSDDHIDAIGIDNYMPLSDWRAFAPNGDHGRHDIVHDLEYLKSNVSGGEGFDWHYSSTDERTHQVRTPISDHNQSGEWVWRTKDLVGWWSNIHHNRTGGVAVGNPTDWVPCSKPFWFTELGCAAVDLGTNEPNAFPDPKSIEDRLPHFSSGRSDPSGQRQFIRAHYDYWHPDSPSFVTARNPVSPIYSKEMVDPSRTYLWAWDARPFPAFPLRGDVWSDGGSYHRGHWLNGRFGCSTASEYIACLSNESDIALSQAESSSLFVDGATVSGSSSVRSNIELLLETDGLLMIDQPRGLKLSRIKSNSVTTIKTKNMCVVDGVLTSRNHPDRSENILRLNAGYHDRLADYDFTSTFVHGDGDVGDVRDLRLPFVLGRPAAEKIAGVQMNIHRHSRQTLSFSLPISQAALEIGDVIRLSEDQRLFYITAIRDNISREVTAVSLLQDNVSTALSDDRPRRMRSVAPAKSLPEITIAAMPPINEIDMIQWLACAVSEPWPRSIQLQTSSGKQLVKLNKPGASGRLCDVLKPCNRTATWDRLTGIRVTMFEGHLASTDEKRVLEGDNRLLIQTVEGNWEEIGFARAQLVGNKTYRLTMLLRGLEKTAHAAREGSNADAPVLLKKTASKWNSPEEMPVIEAIVSDEPEPIQIRLDPAHDCLLPMAPVHLRAARSAGSDDVLLNWLRTSRLSGDRWTYADVPGEADFGGFLIEIYHANRLIRTLLTSESSVVYSAAQQEADFGHTASEFTFDVSQISDVYGPGHRARGTFS